MKTCSICRCSLCSKKIGLSQFLIVETLRMRGLHNSESPKGQRPQKSISFRCRDFVEVWMKFWNDNYLFEFKLSQYFLQLWKPLQAAESSPWAVCCAGLVQAFAIITWTIDVSCACKHCQISILSRKIMHAGNTTTVLLCLHFGKSWLVVIFYMALWWAVGAILQIKNLRNFCKFDFTS